MKKVTSITLLTTAEGKRISLTFSEIDEKGNIVSENKRINKVVVNPTLADIINELEEQAQTLLE